MPYHVEVTARATQDLEAIFHYIQAAESHHAAAWFNGLQEALHSLSAMPHRSPATRENPARRHLLYGTKPHIYRIIYFVDARKKTVTILSIRHRARGSS